jgi:hypothetical protein
MCGNYTVKRPAIQKEEPMVSGTSLRDQIDQKMQELKDATGGWNEDKAEQALTVGGWSVKESLSHLCGPEGEKYVTRFRRFVDEDTPLLEFQAGNTEYGDNRQGMTVAQLLADVVVEHEELAGFVAGLSEEQLARKGHVPLLKDSPLGEYPTLAQLVGGLVNFHLTDHINQIRSARQQIGA